jgi:hypothetical protein
MVTAPDVEGYLLKLAGMITSSPVAGTPLGAQFEAVLQALLVEPFHVLVTAKAEVVEITTNAKNANSLFVCFIVFLCIYFRATNLGFFTI